MYMKFFMIIVGIVLSLAVTEVQAMDVKTANDLIAKTIKDAGAVSAVNNNLRVDLVKGQSMIEETAANAQLAVTKIDFDTKSGSFNAYISVNSNLPFEVAGTFTETTKLPVLARKMDKNEVITKADIAYLDIDATKLRDNFITNEEQLIGKGATRTIFKERPVVGNQIADAKVVDKNKPITITYKNDSLTIRTAGIALDSGSVGQSVRIKNVASNRVIRAKIVDAANAEVNSGSLLASN